MFSMSKTLRFAQSDIDRGYSYNIQQIDTQLRPYLTQGDTMTQDLRVNSDRMLAAFNQLASIGATEQGGVHRPALSESHLAARKWLREEIEQSGLEFHV